jgi:hypothetical protein
MRPEDLGLHGVLRLGPDLASPPGLQVGQVRLDDELMEADHRVGDGDHRPPVQEQVMPAVDKPGRGQRGQLVRQ